VRARILPLNDLADYEKADCVAILLTISPAEAREIMEELNRTERIFADQPQTLAHNARKLYELLQIVTRDDWQQRLAAQDVMNTEGRVRPRASSGSDQVIQIN
jgi:hypothetical protein